MNLGQEKKSWLTVLLYLLTFVLIGYWVNRGIAYAYIVVPAITPTSSEYQSIQIILKDQETGDPIPQLTTYVLIDNSQSIQRTNDQGIIYFNKKRYNLTQPVKIELSVDGYQAKYFILHPNDYPVLQISLMQNLGTQTPLPSIPTINEKKMLELAFKEIDKQFKDNIKANIAFNKPEQMKKDGTAIVQLILNPSLSESALATQLVNQGGFVTSTAEPNVLIAPNGEKLIVETSRIEITPRMKVVLKSQNPEVFTVTEMHDSAEQIISSVQTTTWRWSVTAKREGLHTLELIIYQLVTSDGKEFWHEVETYKANIEVEVTPTSWLDWFKSLDWKWIFATLLIPLAGGLWAWWKNRNKKPDVMQVKIVDERKSPPKRKK